MAQKSHVEVIKQVYEDARAKLLSCTPDVQAPLRQLSCLERILHSEDMTLSEALDACLQLRDIIEPLRFVAKRKVKLMKETKPVRLGAVQGLARRLAPYSKPPPEYSDWSGSDSFCVPGYMFPCPDNSMILRALFYQGGTPEANLRCLPPAIEAELQKNTTTLYKFDSFRPYVPESAPELTAPGDFSIQAYSRAPNYLPSELTVKVLRLRPADATQKVEITKGTSLYESRSMSTVEEARAALRARVGGRIQNRHGLPRNHAPLVKPEAAGPDNTEKVRSTLQKMGGSSLAGGEVVFFKKDGEKAMHFAHPKVTIAPNASVAYVSGQWTETAADEHNTDKQLMELIQKFSANMKVAPTEPEEVPELVPEDFEKEADEKPTIEALD